MAAYVRALTGEQLSLLRVCEIYAFRILGPFEKRSNTGQSTLLWLAGRLWDEERSFEEMMRDFARGRPTYDSAKSGRSADSIGSGPSRRG